MFNHFELLNAFCASSEILEFVLTLILISIDSDCWSL